MQRGKQTCRVAANRRRIGSMLQDFNVSANWDCWLPPTIRN